VACSSSQDSLDDHRAERRSLRRHLLPVRRKDRRPGDWRIGASVPYGLAASSIPLQSLPEVTYGRQTRSLPIRSADIVRWPNSATWAIFADTPMWRASSKGWRAAIGADETADIATSESVGLTG
jgi:hypothetical protein